MVILNEDKLHEHYIVDIQESCKHVDEGHKTWSDHNSDEVHKYRCNWSDESKHQISSCECFKERVEKLGKKVGKKNYIAVAVRRLVEGFLQLSGDEFSAYKWIRLLPRVGDRMKMRCMTPPEAKVEVNDTEPGSVWMVGLPFNNNPNRVQTTTQLSLSKNMCEKL